MHGGSRRLFCDRFPTFSHIRTIRPDTNHMVTVLWDAGRLDEAGRALTATIRNTLPFDSKLDD